MNNELFYRLKRELKSDKLEVECKKARIAGCQLEIRNCNAAIKAAERRIEEHEKILKIIDEWEKEGT